MKRCQFVTALGLSIFGITLVGAHAQAQAQVQAQAPAQAPAGEEPPVTLDALEWLVGSWVRQTSRGEATERWARVSEDTMEGVAFSTAGGTTRVSEHLRIERMGGEVFYVAKPGENPMPTSFKLIEANGTRFVFENAGHDFPQRIIYTWLAEGDLLARIEGVMDGQTRGIDFRFSRKP